MASSFINLEISFLIQVISENSHSFHQMLVLSLSAEKSEPPYAMTSLGPFGCRWLASLLITVLMSSYQCFRISSWLISSLTYRLLSSLKNCLIFTICSISMLQLSSLRSLSLTCTARLGFSGWLAPSALWMNLSHRLRQMSDCSLSSGSELLYLRIVGSAEMSLELNKSSRASFTSFLAESDCMNLSMLGTPSYLPWLLAARVSQIDRTWISLSIDLASWVSTYSTQFQQWRQLVSRSRGALTLLAAHSFCGMILSLVSRVLAFSESCVMFWSTLMGSVSSLIGFFMYRILCKIEADLLFLSCRNFCSASRDNLIYLILIGDSLNSVRLIFLSCLQFYWKQLTQKLDSTDRPRGLSDRLEYCDVLPRDYVRNSLQSISSSSGLMEMNSCLIYFLLGSNHLENTLIFLSFLFGWYRLLSRFAIRILALVSSLAISLNSMLTFKPTSPRAFRIGESALLLYIFRNRPASPVTNLSLPTTCPISSIISFAQTWASQILSTLLLGCLEMSSTALTLANRHSSTYDFLIRVTSVLEKTSQTGTCSLLRGVQRVDSMMRPGCLSSLATCTCLLSKQKHSPSDRKFRLLNPKEHTTLQPRSDKGLNQLGWGSGLVTAADLRLLRNKAVLHQFLLDQYSQSGRRWGSSSKLNLKFWYSWEMSSLIVSDRPYTVINESFYKQLPSSGVPDFVRNMLAILFFFSCGAETAMSLFADQ